MKNILISLSIGVGIALLLLLFREINCWYFKIDEIMSLLRVIASK